MNYYDRHIGDYLKDTAHLSLLQHGIYARLLDVYYTRESGIPEADALRLIGARSKEEQAAALAVLNEFFKPIDGIWIQSRCDAEIARYQHKQEQARRSAEARWSESARNANALHKADAESMRTHSECNAKAMPQAAARPPVPSPSPSPSPKKRKEKEARAFLSDYPLPPEKPEPEPDDPEPLGAINGHGPVTPASACKAMKRAGLQAVNPGDPRLISLVEQGATLSEFEGIAAEAIAKGGKGMAWVLAVVAARRDEASTISLAAQPTVSPDAWRNLRSEVINRGCQLGIGPFDQVAATVGSGPTWTEYRSRVIAADKSQPH